MSCKGGDDARLDAACRRCDPADWCGPSLRSRSERSGPITFAGRHGPAVEYPGSKARRGSSRRPAGDTLTQDYQQRITAAAPADKERILNEAQSALEKAVTDQGLSVEEYNSILEVAQNDPGVRAKIRQRMGAPTE
jgi:hypothetical protein